MVSTPGGWSAPVRGSASVRRTTGLLALDLRHRRAAEHRKPHTPAEHTPYERDEEQHRDADAGDQVGMGVVLAGAERRPAGLVEQRDAGHGEHDHDAAADHRLRYP